MGHAKKMARKKKVEVRSDANQGVRAHNEKIKKEKEYYAKKLVELRMQQLAAQEAATMKSQSTASKTFDAVSMPNAILD